MPLYEYRCDDCEHQFEVLQGLNAGADDLHCPECGADEIAKLYSSFAAGAGSKSTAQGASPAAGCCRGTFT